MLVAISDVHFQDVEHDVDGIEVDHNVSSEAFRNFFNMIAEQYYDNYKTLESDAKIKILLNGDIFDFLRTERWFQQGNEKRPYVDPYDTNGNFQEWSIDGDVNKTMNDIFDSIAGKDDQCLNTAKCLKYCKDFLTDDGRQNELGISEDASKFIDGKVEYLFIPGNHDRFINMSKDLNKKLREHFEIKNKQGDFEYETFPWEIEFPEYKTFALHGHIYDWTNCENNFKFRRKANKKERDEKLFFNTPIGDWITTDLLSRIAFEYRKLKDLDNSPTEQNLAVYKKLKEVDDVRPVTGVVEWLLGEVVKLFPDQGDESMNDVKLSVKKALNFAFYGDESPSNPQKDFFARWNNEHNRKLWPDKSDIFGNVVKYLGSPLLAIPDKILRKLMNSISVSENSKSVVKQLFAYDENEKNGKSLFIENKDFNYLVAGHVHKYSNNFVSQMIDGSEKIYICTGTWRRKHFQSYDKSGFNAMKSMNFVRFFNQEEAELKGSKRIINIWNGLLGKF